MTTSTAIRRVISPPRKSDTPHESVAPSARATASSYRPRRALALLLRTAPVHQHHQPLEQPRPELRVREEVQLALAGESRDQDRVRVAVLLDAGCGVTDSDAGLLHATERQLLRRVVGDA